MRKTAGKTRGVTLVELIVAMAIVAVVVAASSSALMAGIKTYRMNVDSTVGQQSLRAAMMKISKQARDPGNAVAVTGSNALSVNGKSFTVASGNLLYDGKLYASHIASIRASYADASHRVIQIDLVSTDGNTLSTQISLQ
jgi:prepilin-type N-terminal cleavage/methylation domain-containing protein